MERSDLLPSNALTTTDQQFNTATRVAMGAHESALSPVNFTIAIAAGALVRFIGYSFLSMELCKQTLVTACKIGLDREMIGFPAKVEAALNDD